MTDFLVNFVYGFYSSHGSIVVNSELIVDKSTTHTDRSMVIFPRTWILKTFITIYYLTCDNQTDSSESAITCDI